MPVTRPKCRNVLKSPPYPSCMLPFASSVDFAQAAITIGGDCTRAEKNIIWYYTYNR